MLTSCVLLSPTRMRNRLLGVCLLGCLVAGVGNLPYWTRTGAWPSPTGQAPEPEPPTGMVAGDSSGLQPAIAYWRLGHQRQVVLVLHGGPGVSHTYLRPEWDALTAAATVVYYDQRGWGRSDLATCYSWQAHVADLQRVIQAVAPGQRLVLAGSSWGSMLALLYAYQYPQQVNALVLSGTFPWPGKGKRRPLWLLADLGRQQARHVLRDTRRLDTIHERALPSRTQVRAKALLGSAGSPLGEAFPSWPSAPPFDSLRRISVPVLILRGDQKHVIVDQGEAFARLLTQATLYTIPGAGHDPWLADPRTFFRRCVAFLQHVPHRNRKKETPEASDRP